MKRNVIFKLIAFTLLAALMLQCTACDIFNFGGSPEPLPDVNILTPPPGSIIQQPDSSGGPVYVVTRNGYSVSTSNALATAIAADVLESGGNAVEATIAAAYALGVV